MKQKLWPRQEEDELKLDILTSLARSQRALAQLIEEAAYCKLKAAAVCEPQNRELLHEITLLSKYQQVLAEKILMIRLRHRKHGDPGPCLLAKCCQVGGTDSKPIGG